MATPKQMRKLIQLFEETPTEQMQSILGSGFLTDLRDANISQIKRDKFREVCGLTLRRPFDTILFTVDETKTVEELVTEGKYDWSNSNVTSSNFPQPANPKTKERVIVLFHFGKEMTSEQVIAEMDKAGYRPGIIHELLALGIVQPDLQREFPIIALGSVCLLDGDSDVAVLREGAGGRSLSLVWFGYVWGDGCRFLGVRKS
ncbi:MAG: hypothetical protein UR79_C0004G0022 [Candidatus Campbellbacteria bacterium GW2011_GWD1_35_49]|nr:MAG: hypothetical protein UR74_C0004G0022 [Candidatus Campbellbacteria bacterium GW2011_GWD2_35_24]KKP76532.1 MAG: hypothetical protein UR76_C0004G0022 [Candidatus Campbellbacteria bacterium GW2011_GWC1_35_31]KKP78571.1 MAG: hypothetical protein UR79_C0004G0022 [Candidatus Campbellbacteria bacterium GW2011_GWD1_35_49]